MRLLPVWCRAFGALSLGVAALLQGPLAEAQDPTRAAPVQTSSLLLPRLIVHRTDDTSDCPDARALADLVARHMKRPALEPAFDVRSSLASGAHGETKEASLDVQIYRSEEGYTAVVQTEIAATARAGPSTSRIKARQLSDKGSNCAGLAAALSITLAIVLDTEVPPPPASPEPPPTLASSRDAAPDDAEPPPRMRSLDAGQSAAASSPEGAGQGTISAGDKNAVRSAAPLRRGTEQRSAASAPSLGLTAGLGLALSQGALQHVDLAGSGYVELQIGQRLSLSGGVMTFPAQTFPLPFAVQGVEIGKPQISVWLTAGLLRGCVAFPVFAASAPEQTAKAKPDLTRAGGCLGLLAGAIHGEASDLPRTSPSTDPWVAGEVSGLWEQRLFWRFSLVSRAALLIPLVSRTFLVEQGGTAFTPAPIGFALDTEIRLSIW